MTGDSGSASGPIGAGGWTGRNVAATGDSLSWVFGSRVIFFALLDACGLPAERATSRFPREAARRASWASFSRASASAHRASASSSLARRSRFFARRAASFASFRLRLAARDSSFAVCTEFSAVASRTCPNSTASAAFSEGFDIFMRKQTPRKAHLRPYDFGLTRAKTQIRAGHAARLAKLQWTASTVQTQLRSALEPSRREDGAAR